MSTHPPLGFRLTVGIAGVLLAAFAALSTAQTPPTTNNVPAGSPAPIGATAESAPASTAPERRAAPQPDAAKLTVAPPIRGPVDIALVLPLDAPAYLRAAEAVRAGFLAAADGASRKIVYVVIGHDAEGVIPAFELARTSGAKVIVGPLVRDDVKVIAQVMLDLPFTIALNQLDEGTPSLPQIYMFSLAIENDARVLARRMRDDTAQNVTVVSDDSPLMKRFTSAFAAEWILAGGAAPAAMRFDPSAEALTSLKRELAKKPPDGALFGLDGASTAMAKPYLGTVRAYASGLLFERPAASTARDLDGLTVVEVPWLVTPDDPAFAGLPRRDFGSAALERFYALGFDAYRVAQAFDDGVPQRFEFDGATGHITLTEGRQFTREGRVAVFRGGKLSPRDGPR
jgi:uncharacterized protein